MGGVGKTQIAAEYAHRFADSYDIVWWITAELPSLIGSQFAALADALGLSDLTASIDVTRKAILASLQEHDRWLLVFDNAENPEDLSGWLPGGRGHVLITSRTHGWSDVAVQVEVGVLARKESVAILQSRVPGLVESDADRAAEALGDLALAVAQAAEYMAGTGMSAIEYVDLLARRAAEILDKGRPSSYPLTLAAVTHLAVEFLRGKDPAAALVAEISAFLASEPVPAQWFPFTPNLPSPLAERTTDPLAWRAVLALIGRHALARIDLRGIQFHRLTQAIIRGQLSPEEVMAMREHAEAILVTGYPGDPDGPSSWPGWANLLPHLIALDPAESGNAKLRTLACHAATYLVGRGDVPAGRSFAMRLYDHWRSRLGGDDVHTLWIQSVLGYSAREMGRYEEARELDEDNLTRSRRVLGEDRIGTLNAATNLASDLDYLGEFRAARALHEDTLARKRRVLGDDHPNTLSSANNLAISLHSLGETQAARELYETTLDSRRRVLGFDHPKTLISAHNLATLLNELGDYSSAADLLEDTVTRRRSALGDDHPDTLASQQNLALAYEHAGRNSEALLLREEILIVRERVVGSNHTATINAKIHLAVAYEKVGRYSEMIALLEQVYATCRLVLGSQHPDTLNIEQMLAVAHAEMRKGTLRFIRRRAKDN